MTSLSRAFYRSAAILAAFHLGAIAQTTSDPAPPTSSPTGQNSATPKEVTTPSGLKYIDLVVGTGPMPLKGQKLRVSYVGKLEDGKVFDTSMKSEKPYEYYHAVSNQILGWTEGVSTMRVGGKRRLIIPPILGYGSLGSEPMIPPDATLIFEIELLAISGESMK